MRCSVQWICVVVALCLVELCVCGEDYYDILGIGKDADNRAIRKAFKKLALKYHPDKSKEDDAQVKHAMEENGCQ